MVMEKISELKKKKVALVLSGGVVKAASWHLGVALALEELGFTLKNNNTQESDYEISTYVGSSAGALINLYFANGFRPMQVIESFLNKKKSSSALKGLTYKDMLSFKKPMDQPPKSKLYEPFEGLPYVLKKFLKPVLNRSGIFTTEGLHRYILNHVIRHKNFEDYAADLFVIATQLDHSHKAIFGKYNYPNPGHDQTSHYHTDISVSEAVTASMSVPPLYSPYPIKNPKTEKVDYYIDGEIRDTLSTHVAVDNGCNFIISSWTHTPYHYHEEIGSLVNYGLPAISLQAIFLLIQKKIVTARSRRKASEDIINSVNEYLKSNNFSKQHQRNLLSILERKLHYKSGVHLIDIYPKHQNYKVFFHNSFSLNPNKASELVSAGYRRTLEVFKNNEWE